jgi:hypothetical protein
MGMLNLNRASKAGAEEIWMLTQIEADNLIAMPKRIECPTSVGLPIAGELKIFSLVSVDGRESFLLDIRRSRIKMTKCTYQNRYRKDVPLLRLDINCAPHTNPDGNTIDSPHLHIYREGFEDKWAYSLPDAFSQEMNLVTKLVEFLDFCNVENIYELTIQEVI